MLRPKSGFNAGKRWTPLIDEYSWLSLRIIKISEGLCNNVIKATNGHVYKFNVHYPCNYITHEKFNTNLLYNTVKFETSTIKFGGSTYTVLQFVDILTLL